MLHAHRELRQLYDEAISIGYGVLSVSFRAVSVFREQIFYLLGVVWSVLILTYEFVDLAWFRA